LVGAEALFARFAGEQAPVGCEPEPELAAHRLAEAAAGEVVARERAGRRFPEQALVERGRLVEQVVQPPAAVAPRVLRRRGLVVLDRDAEAVGEPLHGACKVEPLRLLHEGEGIAALAAAKAVVVALHGVDGEAGRALLVERAPAGELAAGLPERRALLDHPHEVGRLPDGFEGRVRDPGHYNAAAYSSA